MGTNFWIDIGNALQGWLGTFMPDWGASLTMAFLRAALLASFGLIMFMVLTWIERKGFARFQDRLGPNLAGPFGLFQPLADGIKALTKEDITPAGADRFVFNLAPILSAFAALMVYAVIPFGQGLVGVDLDVGIFYVMAIGALGVLAVLLAGWSSNNKYALVSAFRGVAQLVSYEVPQVLAVVTIIMVAGTMSLSGIVGKQMDSAWYLVAMPVTALIMLISGMAEIGRSPFDLLEADSEIVAGFHIEYSGMKFALFFMGEYVHSFALGAIFSTLFLGGWHLPFVNIDTLAPWAGPFIVTGKALFMFWVLVWIRSTLPRLRIDHMLAFNWKFLVPLGLVNVGVVALLDAALRAVGYGASANATAWALAMLTANVLMLLGAVWLVGAAGRRARLAQEPEIEEPVIALEHAHAEPAH
jgi:NADH-quinone oxidoreductase subunit H